MISNQFLSIIKITKRPFSPGLLVILCVTSCAIRPAPRKSTPLRPTPWAQDAATATTFDFIKNCGIDPDGSAGLDVFKQDLKSLNFVTDSEVGPIKAHVEADTDLSIRSKADSTTQIIQVNINKAINQATNAGVMTNFLTSMGAKFTARARAGTIIYKSLQRKDWLKLTGGSNAPYKDLLCAVTGSLTAQKGENASQKIVFSPASVSLINPLASAEQFKTELGNGRTFTVTASLINDGVMTAAATTQGTISITPTNPVFDTIDPVTNKSIKITADSAWIIVSDFTTESGKFDLVTNKTTYYVDHKNRKFSAIVQEEIKPSSSGMTIPPVILMAK